MNSRICDYFVNNYIIYIFVITIKTLKISSLLNNVIIYKYICNEIGDSSAGLCCQSS